MSDTIRLTDPSAGALQAIADGGLDVTMRVTTKDLEWGWEKLAKIMDAEPCFRRESWADAGHTEDELRLLCGLFCALTRVIPMGISNYIEWLRIMDCGSGTLDSFAVWRVSQMDDEELTEVLKVVLRDRNLDTLGLERIDDPVPSGQRHRGPKGRMAVELAR